MQWYFRIFALLDLVSIYLLYPQVIGFFKNWSEIPDTIDSRLKVYGTIALFVSLFLTCVGLLLQKKWAAITYYSQFIFRVLLWVFSIGFISIVIESFNLGDAVFDIIFRICMIAEFIRLYFTILAHRKSLLT